MPAAKSWAEHGTVRRYRQGGCAELEGGPQGTGARCDKCKLAIREFQQRDKAGVTNIKKMSLIHGKRAPRNGNGTSSTSNKPGPCEQAVMEQLEPYVADHPIRVQMALSAARILDNPDRVALWPTTMRQMNETIKEMTAGVKKKSRGRLAVVQAMTARR